MSNLQNLNVTANATCCDGVDDQPFASVQVNTVGALTVFSVLVFGICFVIVVLGLCRQLTIQDAEREESTSHERKQERRRLRRQFVSNGLIVKEWLPVDPQVESTTGDQDTPPSGETAEAKQPPAPPINSSLASCAMGSDDCESIAGEEEMAGCSICLSHFKPQELVCESNNSSCQHVFHKDCMVDWLMKYHDDCPMCREVYLLKTV
jgi:hypothetical protein